MMRKPRSPRWPSLAQVWLIATIALVALRVQLTPIAQNDFWWHIATGRLIVDSGQVPRLDQFSYSQAGQPYANQPWLAQTAMYLLHQLGGAAALELVQAILIAATFALLFRVIEQQGASPRLAALLTLSGALVAMDNWQIRPQTYALPLFVMALAVLDRWRRTGHARLWLLPLLMLVWVNVHGTFVLLLGLGGIIGLGALLDRWRKPPNSRSWREIGELGLWGSLALAATLVNPQGWRVWSYVFQLLGNQAVGRLVTEWASPLRAPTEPMTLIFLGLLGGLLGLMVWRWRRLTITDSLLIMVWSGLALQSVRNVLWWGVVAALVAARLLVITKPMPARRRIESVLLNRLIVGLLAFLLLATLPWIKESVGLPPELGRLLSKETPVGATAQLRVLPQRPQRLFHEMGFGSYLIWAAPEQRVFVDPRIELYPVQQWLDYIQLGQGKDLDRLAARYGFDGWLVDPVAQADLFKALEQHPRWRQVFVTSEAIYFAPAP